MNGEKFKRCTPTQIQWIMARTTAKSDTAAAKEIGIPVSTVYGWPQYVFDALHEVLEDQAAAAQTILRDAAIKAAKVKVSGLKSKNAKVQHDSATEILDRVLGKPTQNVNANVTADVAVKGYVSISPDDWDTDSTVQAPGMASAPMAGQEQDSTFNG